jgi:hypothetical protein
MKKVLLFILVMVVCVVGIAQPISQRSTSPVTVQDARLFAQFNFRPPAFRDTIEANQNIGLDSCGALIFSRDINAYYYRACSPKRWVAVTGGQVANAWLLGGNTSPTSTYLGTLDNKEITFGTNGIARMRVASTGINRSTTARQKYLSIDTASRYLYYTDGTDTTSLSNRINQNIDSLKRNPGTDSVFARKNGQWHFQYKDSIGSGGSGTVTSISQGYGIIASPNPITSIGTISADTATLSSKYVRLSDTATLPNYWSRTNNYTYLRTSTDSVGIGTSSPTKKLDVNGTIQTNGGINISSNPIYDQSGFFNGLSNGRYIDIYAGNNLIGWYNLVGNVNNKAYYEQTLGFNPNGGSYTQSSFRIASPVTPNTSTNTNTYNQLLINPTYTQLSLGSGTLRGIYYNPTLASLNTSPHYAWESTSGGIKFGGMSSSLDTTTYKPLGIDANGNLSKVSNWPSSGGSGTVTSVATGYGLSGGTITTSGTLVADTSVSGLSGKYVRISDTANRWVNNITRTPGKDSIIFYKDNNRFAIKDSVGTNPPASGYYGAFQDNNTQTAAANNVGYPMKLRINDLTNGITITGSDTSRITFANTGIYNLQFSSQFQNTDNAQQDITIWLRLNGTDVAGSAGYISIPARKSAGAGNEGHGVYGWNYVLSVVAGQYYQIVWSTTNAANVTMQFYTAGNPPPSTASVIATVTQQAGILAGTGITAINSLTGSAQTMVTGTDSTDFKIVSIGTSHTFNLPTASATNRGALSSANWTTFNSKIGPGDTATMLSPYLRSNIASATYLAKSDSSTYYTKYRSDTSRTNIYTAINLKLNISDTANMLSNYVRNVPTIAYLGSDFNTSNTTATNTNLSIAVAANTAYRIMINGSASKATSATGLKVSISAPAGTTIKANFSYGANALNTIQNAFITAINTLYPSTGFSTAIATEVPFRIEGILVTSSTAGNVVLQGATVTSNTATIYANTLMTLTKAYSQ